jgi:hypothetical protein
VGSGCHVTIMFGKKMKQITTEHAQVGIDLGTRGRVKGRREVEKGTQLYLRFARSLRRLKTASPMMMTSQGVVD